MSLYFPWATYMYDFYVLDPLVGYPGASFRQQSASCALQCTRFEALLPLVNPFSKYKMFRWSLAPVRFCSSPYWKWSFEHMWKLIYLPITLGAMVYCSKYLEQISTIKVCPQAYKIQIHIHVHVLYKLHCISSTIHVDREISFLQ